MKHLSLFLILILLACSKNPEMAEAGELMSIAPQDDMASRTKEQTDVIIERKLIKEGQVRFETDDLSASRKNILDAADKYDAYISSDQEYNSPGRISHTIIIRVPAENFDKLLQEATAGIERFESKNINVTDVTEEFLDIQARLKTHKELEERYRDLLKQAKSVTELLEIEKQLGQLRAEIESIEGRLKYLENRVSFSTLTLSFYEEVPGQTAFGDKFENGFRNGWNNLIWFFVALINIWPFVLIAVALFWGIRVWRRRRK